MAQKPSSDKSSVNSKLSNKPNSALKMAHEALREVEEKCQAIINNIEDGYYEVDMNLFAGVDLAALSERLKSAYSAEEEGK